MKTTLVTLVVLAAALTASASIIVPIDLGPDRLLGHDPDRLKDSDIFVSSPSLNGTPVAGQTLSLDYQFNKLIRLGASTSNGFYFAIRAETNMTPMPDALYPSVFSSGYVTGLDGYQGATLALGASSGVSGPNVAEVLFGLVYAEHTGLLYLTGMHFDLVLPTLDGVEITGLSIHIDPNPAKPWNRHWAIVSQVPDTGATVGMFAVAFLALITYGKLSPGAKTNTVKGIRPLWKPA